jgi:hypothetical protein
MFYPDECLSVRLDLVLVLREVADPVVDETGTSVSKESGICSPDNGGLDEVTDSVKPSMEFFVRTMRQCRSGTGAT